MVLADTSIWIQHFRRREPALVDRLARGQVFMHPFVMGELACGNLKSRDVILSDLSKLPFAKAASNSDVLMLIENGQLWGKGLGWIDVHLLASALLSNGRLWTLDKSLSRAAELLGVSGIL